MNKIEERLSRAIESAPSLSVEGLKKQRFKKWRSTIILPDSRKQS